MRTILLALLFLSFQDPTPKPAEPDTILHRMGDLRWQHGAMVTAIAVLPGDKQALTSGYNGAVVLWDLETGLALRTYKGHDEQIFGLALFPDHKRFVTVGGNGKVLLWELESAKPVREFAGHKDVVRAVVVNTDGSRFATGGHDGQVVLWKPDSSEPVRAIKAPWGGVTQMALRPGTLSVLINGPAKSGLIDLETGSMVREFEVKEPDDELKRIRGMEILAFSPDGKIAAVHYRGRAVMLWNAETGEEIGTWGRKDRGYYDIHFTRDGSKVFLSGYKVFEAWEVATLKHHWSQDGDGAFTLATTSDERTVIASGMDGAVFTCDAATGKRQTKTTTGKIWSLAVLPDGHTVMSGSDDGAITIWDLRTGREVRKLERLSAKNYADGSKTQDAASSIAISADGRRAVTGHWDCRAASWEIPSGKLQTEYASMFGTSVSSVSISSDGRFAAGSGNPATLWDLETGQPVHKFRLDRGSYTTTALSPDSSLLLLGSNSNNLRLFETATGKKVIEFDGQPGRVTALEFTPDGRRAVTGSESGEPYQLWDVSTGTVIRKFEIPRAGPVSWGATLAISPDGAFLHTRGSQAQLQVWSLETGKTVRSFEGHLHSVTAIAFSHGGRFVTTGSQDTTIIHRHPGLALLKKSEAWAAAARKNLGEGWKEFMKGLVDPEYATWLETMERGVALGDAAVDGFIREFPAKPFPDAKKLAAILAALDKEGIEDRETGLKSLAEFGESAHSWARERMSDDATSAASKAALTTFVRQLESAPVTLELRLAETRAVLILLELPDSEARKRGLNHFAKGPLNSVAARIARRHVDRR